jgi:hypothetical protein
VPDQSKAKRLLERAGLAYEIDEREVGLRRLRLTESFSTHSSTTEVAERVVEMLNDVLAIGEL